MIPNTSFDLSVTYRNVAELIPYKNNPRTHSSKQLGQIARSIKEFGFTNPILIDDNKIIIAGHGRVAAARQIGISEVPTVSITHLTPSQKRAYIIADNKLAENAGWDEELLQIELSGLLELDSNFDLTVIGFDTGELDVLLIDDVGAEAEEIPEIPVIPVTKPGDLWLLGLHRLLCADATQASSFDQLLGSDKAQLIFTDPPYNVKIDGHVCGTGSIKHADFAMASGEMSPEAFTKFLSNIFEQLVIRSVDGSLHYICMDWRHIRELQDACTKYSELKNLCVWNKTIGGMGSFYRSQHELVFVYKNGCGKHVNNIELGKNGRYRTNVWDFPGVNNFQNKQKSEELAMHPTVKPVQMIADIIMDASNRGDLVLDCFGGSGSTLLAAFRTNRKAALMELNPAYVDVIIERFQRESGIMVTCSQTGKHYNELKLKR